MKNDPISTVYLNNQVGADVGQWPWRDGLYLGCGFDTLRVEPCAIAFKTPEEYPRAGNGQSGFFFLDVIEDEASFKSWLHISASASFNYEQFGASAQYDLYHEIDVESYSVFMVAYVHVVNGLRYIKNPEFLPIAHQIYEHAQAGSQRITFVRTFGDVFVQAISHGGELISVFRFDAKSASEKTSISTSLSASARGLSASGNGSASFQKTIEEISKFRHTVLKTKRNGGHGPYPDDNMPAVLEAALAFPDLVKEPNDVPIAFFTQRYVRVPAVPTIDAEAVAAETAFDDLELTKNRLVTRRANVQFALTNYILFDQVHRESLKAGLVNIEKLLLGMTLRATNIAKNRFDTNFDRFTSIDTSNLPEAPPIASGTKIETLRVKPSPLHGGDPLKLSDDGWYGIGEISTIYIEGVPLPPGNELQYMTHVSDMGNQPWVSQGNTTQLWIGRAVQAIAVQIVGPESARYAVSYGVITELGRQPFYATNGAIAGTTGQYSPIIAMRLTVRII